MLRGIDYAAFATSLVARLRDAGIGAGVTSARDFVRALNVSSLTDLFSSGGPATRLYWTARITLIDQPSDIAAFDAVFAAVFGEATYSLSPSSHRLGPPSSQDVNVPVGGPAADDALEEQSQLPWMTLPATTPANPTDIDAGTWLPERRASDTEAFDDKPFADFDSRDLRRMDKAMSEAMQDWPRRRSRRYRQHRQGSQVAMRATVARARQTGWETVDLIHQVPATRHRRLVMLCDVSQSMQPYVSAYLHFMRAATRTIDCEVFAFATSLTRLTPVLSRNTPAEAIEQASAEVVDRFGGTRIASSLRVLLRSHHGQSLRGAVVIVASDGWDSEPPQELATQMARLRRRAHRIVWFNPRAAEPGFAPKVGGMAAALPYCDRLLPTHNVTELITALKIIDDARLPHHLSSIV